MRLALVVVHIMWQTDHSSRGLAGSASGMGRQYETKHALLHFTNPGQASFKLYYPSL